MFGIFFFDEFVPLDTGRLCAPSPFENVCPKFWEALCPSPTSPLEDLFDDVCPKVLEGIAPPLLNGGYACLNYGRIVHPSSLDDSLENVFPSILGGTVPPFWKGQVPLNNGMMFPHSFGMTYFRGCVPLSSWRKVDGGLSGGYVTQHSRRLCVPCFSRLFSGVPKMP